jgi:phosphoribosyl 1,2-cyclic phosphate phosphodiesterase
VEKNGEDMELIILGSGGATPIPRPGCQCRVCTEARIKGIPYARSGPSMFITDINLLFDTPEEVSSQLNRHRINTVNYIFYTHWHPDHTLGMRVIEKMHKFWLGMLVRGEKPKKVKICALGNVMEDLKAIRNKDGSFLEYYEKMGLTETIELESEKPFKTRNFEITAFEVQTTFNVSTVFLIQENKRKAVYAPCDVKPFPENRELENLDLLIIGSFHPEGPLKEGIIIPQDNSLREELFSMREIQELAQILNAKRTIVTHIEEEWGKTHNEYKQLEKEYKLEFAHDGMIIRI